MKLFITVAVAAFITNQRASAFGFSGTRNGGTCSFSFSCSSSVCRGGNCCGPKGRSTGCASCDNDGDCYTCSSGYTLSNYECVRRSSGGYSGGYSSGYSSGYSGYSGYSSSGGTCTSTAGQCSSSYRCTCPSYLTKTTESHSGGSCYACRSASDLHCPNKATGTCSSSYQCTCPSYLTKTRESHSGGTCYACSSQQKSDGGTCSSSSSCSSSVCRGGNCCGPKGRSTGCTDCDSDGDCSTCSSGYTKTSYQCYPSKKSSGSSCSYNSQCSSGYCKVCHCPKTRACVCVCVDLITPLLKLMHAKVTLRRRA